MISDQVMRKLAGFYGRLNLCEGQRVVPVLRNNDKQMEAEVMSCGDFWAVLLLPVRYVLDIAS